MLRIINTTRAIPLTPLLDVTVPRSPYTVTDTVIRVYGIGNTGDGLASRVS